MTLDEILALICGATLLVYELMNPNMDVERDMYESGDRAQYYIVKYSKWLMVIIGTYCAYRVVFSVVQRRLTR
jgi:hypothetical protein